MSTPTLPYPAPGSETETPPDPDPIDPATDAGLRHFLCTVEQAGSWEGPAGQRLLAETRRRAVRNAAHVAAATDAAMGRGLVDDVLLAAWMVLRRHADKVLAAVRPWAYLMSSAQRLVLDEVRAQQLLTSTSSIRGRTRHVLPQVVRPVGSTAADLASALRHEPSGTDGDGPARIVRQVSQHEQPPLVAAGEHATPEPHGSREPWFGAFVDLLVRHGADHATTVAAVDRLADLFPITHVGWWEWAARRDPVLQRLGLTPDQCSALVGLLAGSRRYRHNGKHDSLLAAVRTATASGSTVGLSDAQRRRVAVFVAATGRGDAGRGDLAMAGV